MICVVPPAPLIMRRLLRLRTLSNAEEHPIDPGSEVPRSECSGRVDSSGLFVESDAVRRLSLGGCLGDEAGVDFKQLLERLERSENAIKADRTLFNELLRADALQRLALGLGFLEFEVRKDAVCVFSQVHRLGAALGAERELAEHLRSRPGFAAALLEGLENQECSPHFGVMLRACAQHSEVSRLLFGDGVLLCLLTIAGECNDKRVEVSLEAFAALRDMLLTQKEVAAAYLNDSFDGFFAAYNRLLQTRNYMVQRQALRLLGDLLLDCCFMKVMVAYVGSHDFLKIHMTLLRDNSRALQLEAFHVFKLFVGDQQKPFKVQLIIFRNQDRITRLLETIALGSCCAETAEEVRIVARAVAAFRPPQKDAGAD